MKRFLLALVNLFAIPGIGTWMAGKKKLGMIQGILSVVGLGLTWWPIYQLAQYLRTQQMTLAEFQTRVRVGDVPMEWEPILLVLSLSLFGIGIYLVNWVWSGFTTKSEPEKPPALPSERSQE